MIIYGNRLFGKVDQIPGVGYVATRFFHLDYLPLIPYQSWLVFQQTGKTWRGVKIPISLKSLLVAWGRTAGVVAMIAGVFGAIMQSTGRATVFEIGEWMGLALAGAVLFAFTMTHKSVTRASYKRACELAKLAKLNPQAMAKLAEAYGQAPPASAIQSITTKTIPTTPVAQETDAPVALEEIPVDAPEPGDSEPAVSPVFVPPTRPLSETRRHG